MFIFSRNCMFVVLVVCAIDKINMIEKDGEFFYKHNGEIKDADENIFFRDF